MLLLQFDPAVDVCTPQPLTMRYKGVDGEMHRYTPDGLVKWRTDMVLDDARPMLVEIKYRETFTHVAHACTKCTQPECIAPWFAAMHQESARAQKKLPERRMGIMETQTTGFGAAGATLAEARQQPQRL